MSSSSTILPVLVFFYFIYLTSEEFTWSMAMCPFSTTAKQYEISPPYWAVCRSNHSDFHGGKKLLWCRVSRCIFSLFPKIVCAKWIYGTQKPLNMVQQPYGTHVSQHAPSAGLSFSNIYCICKDDLLRMRTRIHILNTHLSLLNIRVRRQQRKDKCTYAFGSTVENNREKTLIIELYRACFS